ncbi:MAG: hypothetical protein SFY92_01760 [Verrucomicrobiae bacterium]|nr:hypothetical protein [Verrucomicrobiae bacterium]
MKYAPFSPVPLLLGLLMCLAQPLAAQSDSSPAEKVAVVRYPDGKVRLEVPLRQNSKGEWVENGPVRTYFTDGSCRSEVTYVMGKRHGQWRHWHPNGQLHKAVNFENDTETGVWKRYYPSGRVKDMATFNSDGKYINVAAYYEDGKPACKGVYKRVILLNGRHSDSVKLKDTWQYWDPQGRPISESEYQDQFKK